MKGTTSYMSSWGGSGGAETGRVPEVAFVKSALTVIKECLDKAAASAETDKYLKGSTATHTAIFKQGVSRLTNHVVEYKKDSGTTRLFVAFENVPGALASSPPTQLTTLDLSTSLKSVNSLILHGAFTGSFNVSGTKKSLTDWGRITTVLHELTHSLLRTKDVWFKSNAYGVEPPDADHAVTTEDECLALASAGDMKESIPLCWFNAENWTRAIASCHPTKSGNDMFVTI